MVKFDPDTSREMLLGPVGIRYYLSADFDSLRTDRALGGSADGALLKAIECVLVAFDEPAVWLLEKAKGWLEAAIAMDERPNRYDRNFTEAQRHEDLAQCNWLLTGVHDAETIAGRLRFRTAIVATPPGTNKTLTAAWRIITRRGNTPAYAKSSRAFPALRGPISPTLRVRGAWHTSCASTSLGADIPMPKFNLRPNGFSNDLSRAGWIAVSSRL